MNISVFLFNSKKKKTFEWLFLLTNQLVVPCMIPTKSFVNFYELWSLFSISSILTLSFCYDFYFIHLVSIIISLNQKIKQVFAVFFFIKIKFHNFAELVSKLTAIRILMFSSPSYLNWIDMINWWNFVFDHKNHSETSNNFI